MRLAAGRRMSGQCTGAHITALYRPRGFQLSAVNIEVLKKHSRIILPLKIIRMFLGRYYFLMHLLARFSTRRLILIAAVLISVVSVPLVYSRSTRKQPQRPFIS